MHAVEAGYPVKDGSNEVFIKWKSAGRTCPCRSHSCAAIHDARAETAWFYCRLHGRILRYADRDGLLVLPADPASQILTCHHEHENTHALNAGPIWAGIRFRGCLKKGSIQIFNRPALQRADRTPGLEHIHPARIMPQPRRYGGAGNVSCHCGLAHARLWAGRRAIHRHGRERECAGRSRGAASCNRPVQGALAAAHVMTGACRQCTGPSRNVAPWAI